MYDIIIKGGTVFDGTGEKDGFVSDIGILNGTIAKIGDLAHEEAKKIIHAEGFFVSPGFIDVLNHSDTYLTLFTIPKQESLITQGITTIIGGNCGASLAPMVSATSITSVQKWADTSQINVDWQTMLEFLALLDQRGKLTLNFGTLAGYSTIRNGILQGKQRKLTKEEIDMAGYLLDEALKEGAFGMSSGLSYSGEGPADYDELKAALDIVAKHKKIFTVHLRNEAEKLLDSLEEVLSLAKETGIKLHISALKSAGQKNWSKFNDALAKIEDAKKRGVDVTFDIFPYASNGTNLYTILPAWAKEGNREKIRERLNNKQEREKIEKDLKEMKLDYQKITVASLAQDNIYHGKTIESIAKNWGIKEEAAVIEMLLISNLNVIVFAHILSEENLQTAIKHPLSMIASDGAGYDVGFKKYGALPHPRGFGAFPRFLRKYPNPENQNIISYKDAIRKITSYPAERFGINNRGKIKTGFNADVTIFDPKKIEEFTTFEDPFKYSAGISHVIINGKVAYENGFKDGFYGKVLSKSQV